MGGLELCMSQRDLARRQADRNRDNKRNGRTGGQPADGEVRNRRAARADGLEKQQQQRY